MLSRCVISLEEIAANTINYVIFERTKKYIEELGRRKQARCGRMMIKALFFVKK